MYAGTTSRAVPSIPSTHPRPGTLIRNGSSRNLFTTLNGLWRVVPNEKVKGRRIQSRWLAITLDSSPNTWLPCRYPTNSWIPCIRTTQAWHCAVSYLDYGACPLGRIDWLTSKLFSLLFSTFFSSGRVHRVYLLKTPSPFLFFCSVLKPVCYLLRLQ